MNQSTIFRPFAIPLCRFVFRSFRRTAGTLLAILLLSIPGWGNRPPAVLPERLDSLVLQGKEHIYRLQLIQAQEIFQKTRAEYPDHPHGYVFQAYITALMFAMDQSNDSLSGALDAQVERAIEVAERHRDLFDNHPDSYFFMAIANGIEALQHVVNRSFVKGYWSGRKTKKNLEKVVELDPTYYDAYFGLGLFHYYADLLPGFLKFIAGILGFDGDRVQGKTEVYQAASRGHYFRVEGEFMYHSIGYFLEGYKNSGFRALKQLYRRYPQNQALGLMIAYHYRRSGYLEKCIEYCQKFTDEYSDHLPQITNLRYYNMAVCYYDLNQFSRADSLFEVLRNLPTRKSRYYRAAISFYKGHLADLRFERETAERFYEQIEENNQTKYWYWRSRMYTKFPTDSLMYEYFWAKNLLGSRQYRQSLSKTLQLKNGLENGRRSVNPYFPYLVYDLLGKNYHYTGRPREALRAFEKVLVAQDQFDEPFHRSWFYINYGRCLRSLEELEKAEEMFDRAHDLDDDFTRIIVEREKFILKRMAKDQDEHETDG